MGNRRMFSRRITDSARFLKMGAGAQLLYFHLCMHADDDGVVEAYTVRRGIGANDDDLENLCGRGFVEYLDRENEIVLIMDWNEHNKLRRDRITPSIYRDLIHKVRPDVPLLDPAQRADRKPKDDGIIDVSAGSSVDGTDSGQPMDGQWTDNGLSMGRPRDDHGTDNGRHKISKDKLRQDKLREEKKREKTNGADAPSRPRFTRPTIQEIAEYCKDKGYTHVDAEYFWNYYENINWHVGKNKMKSWKLAVANWEKRQRDFMAGKQQVASSRREIVTYDDQPEWGGIFDGIYDE